MPACSTQTAKLLLLEDKDFSAGHTWNALWESEGGMGTVDNVVMRPAEAARGKGHPESYLEGQRCDLALLR